jgi:predicted peptidase
MVFSVVLLQLGFGVCAAVLPGGVYSTDESMNLSIDPASLPHSQGYHVVRGTAMYHGRRLRFSSGIYLPPAALRSSEPMPIVVTLHNRVAIGFDGGTEMLGEGMGLLLGLGRPDLRASGDKAENPIDLREDAQFIALVPQCPGGFAWERPAMAKLLCNFIEQMVSAYHADDDRVYLTGFSYGASSTWRVAMLAPDRFAAIICCDGRATPDPTHDVEKLKDVAVYLEVGQWDGGFVNEADRMHQALNRLPHRNFIFRTVPGGNHFCYEAVYDDPLVWQWVLTQRRKPAVPNPATQPVAAE